MFARLRKQLLRLVNLRKLVVGYKWKRKKERNRRYYAKLLHSSYSIRNIKSEKLKPYDTLAIITDDGAYVEYMNGKVVGRGYVPMQGGSHGAQRMDH